MANKKFVPITGLDNLSEAEKQQYYINCCEYYNIPAELNLLQFMWLDSNDGTGEKHLVLYAKRGATDLMRGQRGICVDEMKETIGDGFVMFTAKGHDKSGRTDVAVGSANIKGQSGKQLDNSIMTAQTRATRRLTLQFVGGGLLDESEVQALVGGTVTNASVPVGVVAPAPIVQPNTEAGKDITPAKLIVSATNISEDDPFRDVFDLPQATPKQPESTVPVSSAAPSEPLITKTQAPSEEPKKRRRKRQPVSLDAVPLKIEESDNIRCDAKPERRELPRTEPLKTIEDITHTTIRKHEEPTETQLLAQSALANVPKDKLAVAAQEDDEVAQLEAALAKARAKKILVPEVPMELPKAFVEAALPPQPVVIKGLPTEEQLKGFKQRLLVYTNDTLRHGNMKGSEGIGGVEYKVRAFVRIMLNTSDLKHLTVDQWNTFLGYMDEKCAEHGPEGLVKIINEKIGVRE